MNDGGPDFEIAGYDAEHGRDVVYHVHVTDRFWRKLYAGMAMQGYISNCDLAMDCDALGLHSYEVADALIAQRDKNPEPETKGTINES
jgi:hypothetical protein